MMVTVQRMRGLGQEPELVRQAPSIGWPLLILALLIWLERENDKARGFMGGF